IGYIIGKLIHIAFINPQKISKVLYSTIYGFISLSSGFICIMAALISFALFNFNACLPSISSFAWTRYLLESVQKSKHNCPSICLDFPPLAMLYLLQKQVW